MSELGIPVNIETSEINSSLNVTILLVFAMGKFEPILVPSPPKTKQLVAGMYTVIYFSTMYVYLTRRSNGRIVPTGITILFLCNIIQTGVQWYITKWQFVDNGDTRDSVFASLFDGPRWAFLAVDVPFYIGFVLADGLLIWRCFYAWNRSFRIIFVPMLLVTTETALFLVQIIFHSTHNDIVSPTLAITLNNLLAASYFMTFGTSLGTTVLIAYRIYSTAKQQGVSQKRFKHIIDIVVQSGVVYSLALLVIAIAFVLPGANDILNTRMFALTFYISALVGIIAGISATVMVVRVAMLATDATFPTSTSVHLSGLQFHQTALGGETESSGTVSVDRNLISAGRDVERKAQ